MTTDQKQPDLGALQAALVEAQGRYEQARRAESEASSATTRAINDLNAAQKAITVAMEKLAASSPLASDWAATRRRQNPVPA